jgi:hypothetical protein
MGRDKKTQVIEDVGTRHLQVRVAAEKYAALRHLSIQTGMSLQAMMERMIDSMLAAPEAKAANVMAGNIDDPMLRYQHFIANANPHLRVAVERIIDASFDMERKTKTKAG